MYVVVLGAPARWFAQGPIILLRQPWPFILYSSISHTKECTKAIVHTTLNVPLRSTSGIFCNIALSMWFVYHNTLKSSTNKQKKCPICFMQQLDHISLLPPRLPTQCYSNAPGNLGNLGSNKEVQPPYRTLIYIPLTWCLWKLFIKT